MKGRESGMPEKEIWGEFFDPEKVLTTLGVDSTVMDAVEFGCGYGTFAIPAAQLIRGKIYAIDIDPVMTVITREQAQKNNLGNIEIITRDFMAEGTGLKDKSVDYVMLFNILHVEHPGKLLDEACRILAFGGKLGIIHWNYDPSTPRGPSMAIRPKPEDCIQWAENAGFHSPQKYDLKPYHYGIVLKK